MASSQHWPKTGTLRQTHIGFSARNTLTIRGPQIVPGTEAFIFRLPDELLVTIFELATLNSDSGGWYCESETLFYYEGIKSLALTCHRFNLVVLPLLYRTIRFDDPYQQVVPPTKAAKSLNSGLQKDLSLRRYCWLFSIDIHDDKAEGNLEKFSIANNLVSWLTKVRCFRIHGGFSRKNYEHTWAVIRNVAQHMRELEHLSIIGYGPYLRSILEQIDIPSLKRLDVGSVTEAEDGHVVIEPKVLSILSFIVFLSLREKDKQAFDTCFLPSAYEY